MTKVSKEALEAARKIVPQYKMTISEFDETDYERQVNAEVERRTLEAAQIIEHAIYTYRPAPSGVYNRS